VVWRRVSYSIPEPVLRFLLSSPPTPQYQTIVAANVANSDANKTKTGPLNPSIAMLVNVAKIPPAGVKPPYINDWKAAARDPVF